MIANPPTSQNWKKQTLLQAKINFTSRVVLAKKTFWQVPNYLVSTRKEILFFQPLQVKVLKLYTNHLN
jgi:hypothetical protein